MSARWKDVMIRSLKTFAQAFGGALVVLLSTGNDPGLAITKTAIISALAAAISAVWNTVLAPALTSPEE